MGIESGFNPDKLAREGVNTDVDKLLEVTGKMDDKTYDAFIMKIQAENLRRAAEREAKNI